MKVSIITVVYNNKESIEEAILSVASQTHTAIEHIIVDGGSTDGTLDIIAKHADKLARVISEPDKGIYDAMNKGLRCATGDIIGLLNSDDKYAHKDVIDRVVRRLSSPEIEAVFADAAFVAPGRPDEIVRRYSSRYFRPSRIAWGWMPAHPTLFLKREVYGRYGFFKPDFKIAGDYEFVARIFWNTGIRYIYMPEILVKMKTGGVSTSGWAGTVLLNREVLRACRENGIRTNMVKICSKYFLKIFEFIDAKT
ncbi:MAG: glycosyltransferase family 2 protein [Pseudomonadota bacterium]